MHEVLRDPALRLRMPTETEDTSTISSFAYCLSPIGLVAMASAVAGSVLFNANPRIQVRLRTTSRSNSLERCRGAAQQLGILGRDSMGGDAHCNASFEVNCITMMNANGARMLPVCAS